MVHILRLVAGMIKQVVYIMVVMAVLVVLLVNKLSMAVVMAAMVKVLIYGVAVLGKEQPHVLLLKPMVCCFLMEVIVVWHLQVIE